MGTNKPIAAIEDLSDLRIADGPSSDHLEMIWTKKRPL